MRFQRASNALCPPIQRALNVQCACTVRFRIRNIYQKFEVRSRTELMELFDADVGVEQARTRAHARTDAARRA